MNRCLSQHLVRVETANSFSDQPQQASCVRIHSCECSYTQSVYMNCMYTCSVFTNPCNTQANHLHRSLSWAASMRFFSIQSVYSLMLSSHIFLLSFPFSPPFSSHFLPLFLFHSTHYPAEFLGDAIVTSDVSVPLWLHFNYVQYCFLGSVIPVMV